MSFTCSGCGQNLAFAGDSVGKLLKCSCGACFCSCGGCGGVWQITLSNGVGLPVGWAQCPGCFPNSNKKMIKLGQKVAKPVSGGECPGCKQRKESLFVCRSCGH